MLQYEFFGSINAIDTVEDNNSNDARSFDIIDTSKAEEIIIMVKNNDKSLYRRTIKFIDNNWKVVTENITAEDIAEEYFSDCQEDNGYDNSLIFELSKQYNRTSEEIKNIIESHRKDYII